VSEVESGEKIFRAMYAKGLRYLAVRGRSEKEMRSYLEKAVQSYLDRKRQEVQEASGISAVVDGSRLVEKVLVQLRREGFVDDRKFAQDWVESRLRRGKRGPEVIRYELKVKGINEEIVAEVLTLSEGEGVDSAARVLAEKYASRVKAKSELERKMKVKRYLLGKGFGWEVIERVV
jgi:regulatory protein